MVANNARVNARKKKPVSRGANGGRPLRRQGALAAARVQRKPRRTAQFVEKGSYSPSPTAWGLSDNKEALAILSDLIKR